MKEVKKEEEYNPHEQEYKEKYMNMKKIFKILKKDKEKLSGDFYFNIILLLIYLLYCYYNL